jgi:hypothetical protein
MYMCVLTRYVNIALNAALINAIKKLKDAQLTQNRWKRVASILLPDDGSRIRLWNVLTKQNGPAVKL